MSRSWWCRGKYFDLGSCYRFTSHIDKRLSPKSKIVLRLSFLLFSYSGLKTKASRWKYAFWNKKQNLKSCKSCLVKVFLWCASRQIKMTDAHHRQTYLMSCYFFTFVLWCFGLGRYRWDFVGGVYFVFTILGTPSLVELHHGAQAPQQNVILICKIRRNNTMSSLSLIVIISGTINLSLIVVYRTQSYHISRLSSKSSFYLDPNIFYHLSTLQSASLTNIKKITTRISSLQVGLSF